MGRKPYGTVNQRVTKAEMRKIRALTDWGLLVLIGMISDHGWIRIRRAFFEYINEKSGGKIGADDNVYDVAGMEADLRKIRNLDDFDLIMLVSDIHDFGWEFARRTLGMMPEGNRRPQPPRKKSHRARRGDP